MPFTRCLGAVLLLAAAPARATEVVPCAAFKSAGSAALRKADLSRTAPGYGPKGRMGAEAVTNLTGLDASVTCREGSLGRLQLRGGPPVDAVRFDKAVGTVLAALDRDLSLDKAAIVVAALRAETGQGSRNAVSSWGPYEITLGRAPDGVGDELIVDMAEN